MRSGSRARIRRRSPVRPGRGGSPPCAGTIPTRARRPCPCRTSGLTVRAACCRWLDYASPDMASLESLPPDQRAVLQLVLQRGRSYDEIAQMLKIDRAAVRQRALAALDAIGPDTRVDPERRALITDYLLGSLPPRVQE